MYFMGTHSIQLQEEIGCKESWLHHDGLLWIVKSLYIVWKNHTLNHYAKNVSFDENTLGIKLLNSSSGFMANDLLGWKQYWLIPFGILTRKSTHLFA